MHFYQKNIGDFNNATRHLTRVERSLFSDAIELYYDTEKPLTTDFDRLARLLLAHTTEEKSALRDVLNEFFTLTDDGYFNKRCNEEILKYQSYMESKSKAGKASAQQRANNKATSVEQVLNTSSTKYKPLTINQEPLTSNQELLTSVEVITSSEVVNFVGAEKSAPKKSNSTSLPKEWLLPKTWGEWALNERPELSVEQIRKEAEKFKDHWLANSNQAKSKKSDWEATWRNWVRNAKVLMVNTQKNKTIYQQSTTEQAKEKLFGARQEKDITHDTARV